jgi:hypothetical protein
METETALLDFQYETASLVHLAQSIEEDGEVTDEVLALCRAVRVVHQRAEEALQGLVEWADNPCE